MFCTIINDCSDVNAQGRQETRVRSLLSVTPSFIAVPGTLDHAASLEASGNIIDILSAAGGEEGVILANVAPRNSVERSWGNGTPFASFRYRRTNVIASITGLMLTLPQAFGLLDEVRMINIPETLRRMWAGGLISETDITEIEQSQFRSFDFLPRVAQWMALGHTPAFEQESLPSIPTIPPSIWAIDNFGNMKTTLTARDIPEQTQSFTTKYGTLPFIRSLHEVPDNTAALTIGSSGLPGMRFAEIVIQGGSAAEHFKACVGDHITEV